MSESSVPKIKPVIIPRHQWSEVEELVSLSSQALHLARRHDKASLEVASGCLELLSTKARAITWRTADDLEDWEQDEKSGEEAEEAEQAEAGSQAEKELCIVEVRLCKKDRRALREFMDALNGLEGSDE